jgi:hypothetical protein
MGKVHYVDKAEFYARICDYKKACREAKKAKKPKPQITTYLCRCIMLIAENLSYTPKYSNYSFRDEMVDDAIENCIMYFDNFNEKKYKNPFGYFTQISIYAFWRRIAKEKKHLYTKYKVAQQSGLMDEDLSQEIEDGLVVPTQLYDNIQDFIREYENKELERKSKNKIKKEKIKPTGKIEKFME